MIVYMTHPQHGTHIAYSEDEVARCKLSGWSVRDDAKKAQAPQAPPAQPVAQPVQTERKPLGLPKRRPDGEP